MPRYFFDLPSEPDDLGAILVDDVAARGYALRCAAELTLDSISDENIDRYWRIDVRQEDGSFLLSVLTEVLPARHLADRRMLERELAQAKSLGASLDQRVRYI